MTVRQRIVGRSFVQEPTDHGADGRTQGARKEALVARLRLTFTQKRTAEAIVNVFETGRVAGDYGRVTVTPGDAGHLTYGRTQTTLASGGLALLVSDYCDANGVFAGALRPYLPALEACDVSLDTDGTLHDILRRAGMDPTMRRVQDGFFDRVYWQPALQSAEAARLCWPLSVAVVYDSVVHGSYARMRRRATGEAGSPDLAGEKRWISTYVEVRRRWLATHRNPLLRRTVYRMDAFASLIREGRWTLRLPLTVRGVVINRTTLDGVPDVPVVASAADPSERALLLRMLRTRKSRRSSSGRRRKRRVR
jgi:chitosanase